jgi:hypothetical protein
MELAVTLLFSVLTAIWPGLTPVTLFPIALGSLLVVASLVVAVRFARSVDRQGALRGYGPAVALVVGSVAVFGSLLLALAQPASIPAFVVGAVGATCCYATVLPALFAEGRKTVALQAVTVLSLLWIAGFLTVGATASGGTRHYEVAGLFGLLSIAVAFAGTVSQGWTDGKLAPVGGGWSGWLFLGAVFLLPAAIGAVFGEEVLFVAYLAATVIGTLLWWFSRLAGY